MNSFKKATLATLLLLTPLSHSNTDICRNSILNLEGAMSKNVLATVICSAAFLIKSIRLLLRPADASHAKPTGNTTPQPSNAYQGSNILDFKNNIPKQAPNEPQLSAEEQTKIMYRFDLYADKKFIEQIKTFSHFKPIILKIHRDIQKKDIIYPDTCNTFGFKKNFKRTVNRLANKAKSMPDVKTSNQPSTILQPALTSSNNQPQPDYAIQTKNYTLSPQAIAALESAGINAHQFTACKGDTPKQDIHAKFVNTINVLAGYRPKTAEGELIKSGTIECTQAGVQLNKEGHIREAMHIADFCCLITEKAFHFLDSITPLGFVADASVSALRLASAHDFANSIEAFRANADTFRAGFTVGIIQGITDIENICNCMHSTVHALKDLIHIIDDAFLFEEAFEIGRHDIIQPIIKRNLKRYNNITEVADHVAQKSVEFINQTPEMTTQEWQQAGLTAGNFIGQEAAQLGIMHIGFSGLNKINKGIALSADKFKTATQEFILSAHLSGTPAIPSNITRHIYGLENLATQNGSRFVSGIPATHPELATHVIINASEQLIGGATQMIADTNAYLTSQAAGALQLGKELGCLLTEAKPGFLEIPKNISIARNLQTNLQDLLTPDQKIDITKLDLNNLPLNIYDETICPREKLQELTNQFKDTPGALGKDGPLQKVLEMSYIGTEQGKTACARGALYELETAASTNSIGDNIVKFNESLQSGSARREFDIITANKAIECKNIDWTLKIGQQATDMQMKLAQQAKIARDLGKEFIVHSKHPLTDNWTQWFLKKDINVKIGA